MVQGSVTCYSGSKMICTVNNTRNLILKTTCRVKQGKTCFPHWNLLPTEGGKCWWHKGCAACQNTVQSIWKWLNKHDNDDDDDDGDCTSWSSISRMEVNAAGVEKLNLRAKITLFWGRKYRSSEEELAIHEWLCMQESDLYHDEILTLMPGLQKCNSELKNYGEKQRSVSGLNELHKMVWQFLISFLWCGEPDLLNSLDIWK